MIHIDIYLENTEKYVKKKQGWYGYVLTYQGREFHTADGYGKAEDTRNGRDARMLLEALGRCKPNPYDITVYTDSAYLQGTCSRLEKYRENNWKKADGTDLKYKELWQKIAKKAEKKEITFRIGKTHAYTERIWTEIERRKKDDKQRTERISGTIQG